MAAPACGRPLRLPDRRSVLRLGAGASLAIAGYHLAYAQADRLQMAAAFIRDSGNELAALARAAKSSEDERRRLGAFIDRVADIDGVARFCLGRFWRMATPGQRARYLRAYHGVLLRTVVTRLGEYEGGTARVAIGKPSAAGEDIDVPTVVERSGDPPAHITWVVSMKGGSAKIIDVVAEGISMRLTQRNDYASFIEHNGGNINALIEALERQAAAAS